MQSFTIETPIWTDLCNQFGQITLPGLIQLTLRTSEAHEHQFADMRTYMEAHKLGWIITANQMTIHRLPKFSESVRVVTEIADANQFFTFRKFQILDKHENLLVEVITTFSLLHLDTRRIARTPDIFLSWYELPNQRSKYRQLRLPKSLSSVSQTKTYYVQFLDIDGNGHVNNAVYFRWLSNALGLEWFKKYREKRVTISYIKEALLGESVTVNTEMVTKGGEITTLHAITDYQGELHSMIEVQWEERK